MTLHACDLYSIPEETARIARKAFPKGNVYLTMRDELDLWYKDSNYADLFTSTQGRPAESPGRLNLIMVMQYAEGLTDQQAAEAVGSRIDWKYALGLELSDPGFHYSILSDHRQRLLAGGREQALLEDILDQFGAKQLLKARSQQRTDSTHVLAAIREMNRLECLGESLRFALNSLAQVSPTWLVSQVTPDWFERYGPRFEQYRLPKAPAERQALAEQIGQDGSQLLTGVDGASAPPGLDDLPALRVLRQVWIQQFSWEAGQLRLRSEDNLPPAELLILSPYDVEARYGQKRETQWSGYKVHLTETCEQDQPHLITNVETTPASQPDQGMLPTIHEHLAAKERLPGEHLIDAGYLDADELVNSPSQYEVELIGPVALDTSWQAKAEQGFALACFGIDWSAQQVTCPQGKVSQSWRSRLNQFGTEVIEVRFAKADCAVCVARPNCTHATDGPRSLKFRPQAQHHALQTARQYQTTAEFKQRYNQRAGIEGTISQGVRCFDLRRARYIGLAKTHLQHILTAAAINLTRAVAWLQEKDRAKTRVSPFAALAAAFT